MARAPRDLLAVRGLRVGQAVDPGGPSGVTCVVFDRPAPSVVDVRGGAPGTYDTASLALDATFGRRWSIFFSGGSLFGLDAARGIRAALLEEGKGSRAFGNRRLLVPISGAVIFDLPRDDRPLPDYAELGYRAARAARRSRLVPGRFGAGAGATVAKYLGRDASCPGGIGSAGRPLGDGRSVGVLVVVNAAGAIRDPANGRWVATARGPGGRGLPPTALPRRRLEGRGTTLALVATDAPLERAQLARVAAIVHAGLGRAVVPYLTSVDGDCVFAATTSSDRPRVEEERPGATADQVGRLAADAAVDAVLSAVRRSPRASPAGRQ